VEEVTVMPETRTLKLRMEGCMGGVSATKVKLILAGPPPPQFVVHFVRGPLQEDSDKAANKRTAKNKRVLLRFI
jgi:hypothetical protein